MARIHPSECGNGTTHALAQAKQGEGEAKRVDAGHEVDRDSGVCQLYDIGDLGYLKYQ